MMTNKWVQAAILLGAAAGMFLGTFLSLIHYALPMIVSFSIGMAAMNVAANARGTDGWGGPYRGK